MLNRKMLDALYDQKFKASAKLERLKGDAEPFASCATCNESPSYQRHIADVFFLEEKVKYLDILIDIYLAGG